MTFLPLLAVEKATISCLKYAQCSSSARLKTAKSHWRSSTHHHHILLSSLGGVLGGGHLVPLQGDDCLAVPPVRCVLLKLFAKSKVSDFFYPISFCIFHFHLFRWPEFQLDALDCGLGDHRPVAAVLGDGHHWGGSQGCLPQDESHPESLQELLVLLRGDLCVCSCDGGHFVSLVLLGWCLDVQWGGLAAHSPKVDMEFTLAACRR